MCKKHCKYREKLASLHFDVLSSFYIVPRRRFKRLEVFPVGEKGGVWGGLHRFADFGVPNEC